MFVEADLERLEAAIASQELDDKLTRQELGTAPVYWVHIPPLRSKRHAEQKMGELKRLGITHFTRVDDTSKWNNAISMGFFENIEDAQVFERKDDAVERGISRQRAQDCKVRECLRQDLTISW